MTMRFTDAVTTADPTHRLVTRDLPGVSDWDEVGSVSVENRALDVLLEYGTAVHLQLDSKHGGFETVDNEATRVPEAECVFHGSDPEYRAALPEDRSFVRSLLEIQPDDTNAWIDRTFYHVAFAVLDGRTWIYRSVPHETHIRELNATDHDGLVERLQEALAELAGSAIVPYDGLASWVADGVTYRLQWDSLQRSSQEGHVSYDIERLQRVTVRLPRRDLQLDWRSSAEESLLRRIVWRILAPESTTPPTHVALPEEGRSEPVLTGFRQLRSKLDYSYELEIVRSSR